VRVQIERYQFIADHDHRNRFAGNAYLAVVDNGMLMKNKISKHQGLCSLNFKLKIWNVRLIDADMLRVERSAFQLLDMSDKMLDF